MNIQFERIDDSNTKRYGEHKLEVVQKSGIEGNPIYNAYSQQELVNWKWPNTSYLLGKNKKITEPYWRRSWGVMDDNKIIGSLDLIGGRIPSALHRCSLMMGVASNVRKRGIGRKILSFATNWAKENGLLYVDLSVLGTNIPAHKLYTSFGFLEIGRKENSFIIYGIAVDEIQMTFPLLEKNV